MKIVESASEGAETFRCQLCPQCNQRYYTKEVITKYANASLGRIRRKNKKGVHDAFQRIREEDF